MDQLRNIVSNSFLGADNLLSVCNNGIKWCIADETGHAYHWRELSHPRDDSVCSLWCLLKCDRMNELNILFTMFDFWFSASASPQEVTHSASSRSGDEEMERGRKKAENLTQSLTSRITGSLSESSLVCLLFWQTGDRQPDWLMIICFNFDDDH